MIDSDKFKQASNEVDAAMVVMRRTADVLRGTGANGEGAKEAIAASEAATKVFHEKAATLAFMVGREISEAERAAG
jgi:hypothetical protein